VNSSDRLVPLMTAIDEGDTESIKEMLTAAAAGEFTLTGSDSRGDSVFHHVARASNERISQVNSDTCVVFRPIAGLLPYPGR